jgi:ribosomal protein S27E
MRPDDREIKDTELSSIVLPSGIRLEILYVDGEPFAMSEESKPVEGGTAPVDTSMLDALDDLTLCGSCGSPLVQPTGWKSHGAQAWELELRCPECEERATTVIEDELAEHLTLFHERARALMELSMVRLASDNAEREIERFARALEQDLILPEDF